MDVIRPGWKGYLTHKNIDNIADALLKFLDGKIFTVATVYNGHMPCLWTGMSLCDPKIGVNKGDPKTWDFNIIMYYSGGRLSVNEAFYVKTLNDEVNVSESTHFEFSYEIIEITSPRLRGMEYQVFQVQNF